MNPSIWPTTLTSFCDDLAGTTPAPAAVAAASVTANLGLSLLIKVLAITGKRKSFTGDLPKLKAMIESARHAAEQLKLAADDDIAAVREYLSTRNPAAVLNAIEVPMRAARAAASGVNLCTEAASLIHGLTAADLGAAVLLLSAAVRAILLSVDFNLPQLTSEEQYKAGILFERRALEAKTATQTAAVLHQISKA